MKTFENFLYLCIRFLLILAIPFTVLNLLSGIVSGIWLIFLGEWSMVGIGILSMLVSGMVLGFVMLPGLIFDAPAIYLTNKGYKLSGYFFGFLSILYTICVLTIWCILVLVYHTKQAEQNSIIPILFWSYNVAIVPIAWLAKKDSQSGNEYATIMTFFIGAAYILNILVILLVGVSPPDILFLFAFVMLIGAAFQFLISYLFEKNGMRL